MRMSEPMAWPVSTFELDAGLGLAVCVVHRGSHVWHLGGCVAFARGRQPKALRVKLTEQDREIEAAPIRVELDEARLAAGIAMALDGLMQRRREERAVRPESSSQQPPTEPTASPSGSGILDRYSE